MQIPYSMNDKITRHTVTTPYQAMNSHENTDKTSRASDNGVFAVDISGIVKDNIEYDGQGWTAEDVMQQAELTDVTVQRDYMTVMSNSMSGKDFEKMCEEGYSPEEMDADTVVTIVDKIKATMAQAGVEVVGYNDDLDLDKLKDILKSTTGALALKKAFEEADVPVNEQTLERGLKAMDYMKSVRQIGDGTFKYMTMHLMPPTIENFYLASHCAGDVTNRTSHGYYNNEVNGYYAKVADDISWDKIKDQMSSVLEEAGFESSDELIEKTGFLIKSGIPYTAQNVKNYLTLDSIALPMSEEKIASCIAAAMSMGKDAIKADCSKEQSIVIQSAALAEAVSTMDEEKAVQAVETLVSDGHEIHLEAILSAIANNQTSDANADGQENRQNSENREMVVSARRNLEEIRLLMTTEANIRLLKSGFSIETAPLQELVDRLKESELQSQKTLFATDDVATAQNRSTLFDETLSIKEEVKRMPIAFIGTISTEEGVTLRSAHRSGALLQQAYETAGETYEALMTAPSTEYGDSLRTAFQNSEAILQDLDLSADEQHLRAIRILGYSRMDMTAENVDKVMAADAQVRNVVSQMTPSTVLKMIRKGVNPLDNSLSEVAEKLSQINEESGVLQESENYAKFLTRMEHVGKVSDAEKESYIGIFRLLRRIEKSDGAAVGTLISQGNELSFSNLLSAVRSRKFAGCDVRVNDSFNGYESISLNGATISEQIYSSFVAMGQADSGYYEERAQVLQRAVEVSDEAIQEVLSGQGEMSTQNVLAANALLQNPKSAVQRLLKQAQTLDEEETVTAADGEDGKAEDVSNRLEASMTNVLERFTGNSEVTLAYEDFLKTAGEIVSKACDGSEMQSLDIRALSLSYKQLSVASFGVKEENYRIPLQIDGEWTMVHVQLRSAMGTQSGIRIATESEALGTVDIQLQWRDDKLQGTMMYDKSQGSEQARKLCDIMNEKAEGEPAMEMLPICGRRTTRTESNRGEVNSSPARAEYYRVARRILIQMNNA